MNVNESGMFIVFLIESTIEEDKNVLSQIKSRLSQESCISCPSQFILSYTNLLR